LGLGDQALGGGERRAQAVDDVEVQARQIAGLVDQHLRLVLQLIDLVVDLLQRADCRQRVLHKVGGVDERDRRCGLRGQQRHRQHGGQGYGKSTGLHGETSSG
jgi:hypothetical protein